MKKVLILASALYILTGCSSKDNPIEEKAIDRIEHTQSNPIEVQNGMLSFEDMDTYLQTVDALNQSIVDLQDDFATTWGSLSDEAFTNKIDELGFNPYLGLETFSSGYSYNSLHAQIETQLAAWLQVQPLDFTNDPNDIPIQDYGMRAILNEYRELKIGEVINAYTDLGVYVIGDEDFEISDAIRSGTYVWNPSVDPHVEFYPYMAASGGPVYCASYVHRTDNPQFIPSGTYPRLDFHYYATAVSVYGSSSYTNGNGGGGGNPVQIATGSIYVNIVCYKETSALNSTRFYPTITTANNHAYKWYGQCASQSSLTTHTVASGQSIRWGREFVNFQSPTYTLPNYEPQVETMVYRGGINYNTLTGTNPVGSFGIFL